MNFSFQNKEMPVRLNKLIPNDKTGSKQTPQQQQKTPLLKMKSAMPSSVNRFHTPLNTQNLLNVRSTLIFFERKNIVLFVRNSVCTLSNLCLVPESFNGLTREYNNERGVFYSTEKHDQDEFRGTPGRGEEEAKRGGCEEEEGRSSETADGGEEEVSENHFLTRKTNHSRTNHTPCVRVVLRAERGRRRN